MLTTPMASVPDGYQKSKLTFFSECCRDSVLVLVTPMASVPDGYQKIEKPIFFPSPLEDKG